VTDDSSPRAPYPGLRAFRREETDLFFGREDCINAMVDRLAATRFLAVLGSSGTGKSSLVKTGLLDALELGLMVSAGSRWQIVDFRPGGAPLKHLARRLLETADPYDKAEHTDTDVDLLRAFLARGPRSAIEWCRSGHLLKGANLLLLVDQFEELFRYQNYADREEAESFVALLLESARTREFPIYVAITMRSEYLGACALIEGLADAINAGMFLTPRMTRDLCHEAIVGPAAVCDIDIEPALVNRLLNDLANFAPWDDSDTSDQLDRIMRRADQLPLLQYTLNRMWLRARSARRDERIKLTITDYEAIGGLSGALNAHANQIFEELGKQRWPVVEWVFRTLTAGSTIADAVRRPTRFDELVAACGGDEANVRAVVDAFRAPGVNFLVPEFDPKHPRLAADAYVDISHESLIRQWKRLGEWLEQEARAAQQWRRLIDRFGTGEPVRGRELANMMAWRNETKPNTAWAKRYGGDYPAVIAFLERSNQAQRRKRLWMAGGAAAVFLLMIQATVATYLNNITQANLAEANLAQAEIQANLAKANLAQAEAERAGREAEREGREKAQGMLLQAENERRRAENERLGAEQNYESLSEFLNALIFNITQKTKDAEVNTAMTIASETLAGIRKLTERNPADNEYKRFLTVTLNIYGDVKLRMNDAKAAEDAFNESLEICRTLLELDPDKTLWQDDLTLAVTRVGQAKVRKEQFAEARKLYEEAIEIDRKLIAATPTVERLQTNFQLHLGLLGDVLLKLNDPEAARKAYEERLDIRRRLLDLAFDNTSRQEDVSAGLDKVGDMMRQAGDLAGARKMYEEELELDRKLYEIDPNKKSYQENIVWSLRKVGDIWERLGDLAAARKTYQEAVEVDRKLAAYYPSDLMVQNNVQSHLQQFAELLLKLNDSDAARNVYDERLSAYVRLVDIRRQNYMRAGRSKATEGELVSALGYASWNAVLSNRPREAVLYGDEAIKLDPTQGWIDINRAHGYLFLGRYDDAKKIYEAVKKLPHRTNPRLTLLEDAKEDFALLRRLHVTHPSMDLIQKDVGF
jgi:tetratricopeptide (TPR) repeat protein